MIFADSEAVMRYAVEAAAVGFGSVEPNPQVGAVVVDDRLGLIAAGIHKRFGGPHAEVNALSLAGDRASGATLYVTLEPCCHHGKTGPCTQAILDAGIRRVVVGSRDPFPAVDGRGIAALRDAGVDVQFGILSSATDRLIAPFRKLATLGIPWVHAKWAMSLDGRIATRTGHSQWISSPPSREIVHWLRGRVDAVIVGAQTAIVDDPSLTARPPGPRTAVRVVVDGRARLPLESNLVRTAREIPVILATSESAEAVALQALESRGVEVLRLPDANPGPPGRVDLAELLGELGRREMTHVLIEGGGGLLGSVFDDGLADEVHVFVAPKIVGGADAVSPVAGRGRDTIPELGELDEPEVRNIGSDVYIHGRLRRDTAEPTAVVDSSDDAVDHP